jgi:glycerophosphoryl diester phosphodiesterase
MFSKMTVPTSSHSFSLTTNAVPSPQGTHHPHSNAFTNGMGRMAFSMVPRPFRSTNLAPNTNRNHGSLLFGNTDDSSSPIHRLSSPEQEVTSSDARLSLRDVLGLNTADGRKNQNLATLSKDERARIRNIQVVGHRGALYEHFENTLESFLYCARCGCDAVELDVFVIRDGAVVVFHGRDNNPAIPGSLEGYCVSSSGDNSTGVPLQKEDGSYRSIMDLTFAETQQLRFNSEFAEFPCPTEDILTARIPTLEEVLLALSPFSSMKEIKIELKGPGTVLPVLCLVERLGQQSRCSFSSFDHAQLKQLRNLCPDKAVYRTGALFDAPVVQDFLDQATACGATDIHLRYDDCTVERIQDIHFHNFTSMAWFRGPVGMRQDADHRFHDIGEGRMSTSDNVFLENKNCYRIMIETGVQQICCNRPDLLMRVIQEQLPQL